ncbi:Vacuolar protein-sorting-associated protein 36 [Pestalotiopsis sp. IQ-011]
MKDDGGSPAGLAPALDPRASQLAAMPTKPSAEVKAQLDKKWNTKNLGLRLAADFASAACAASMVAPLISVIDRSIMENASGRSTMANALKSSLSTFLRRPHALLFSKPVALIFMVYGGTYLTANTLDTATSTVRGRDAGEVSAGTLKFAASSAANVGICIYKDQVYVKLFGPAGPPRPVGLPSYVLFTVRDCMTIFASFNVPPLLGPVLSERLSAEFQKKVSGQTLAQFAAPAAVQMFSTPLHLVGLDMYNRPGQAWAERWLAVKKNWAVSTAARICRIVPAFGVGGVVNTRVRKNFMEKLA